MKDNRPSILIYTYQADTNIVREVCAGIEEEGVLYEVKNMQGTLDALAYQAANESSLSVGIAIVDKDIALQVRLLAEGENLFTYKNADEKKSRDAGANGARVIKRSPFKMER